MKSTIRKQNMTKLLLTASMCAILLFGATACNDNSNVKTNESTDNIGETTVVTDDNVLPTETIDPEDSSVE